MYEIVVTVLMTPEFLRYCRSAATEGKMYAIIIRIISNKLIVVAAAVIGSITMLRLINDRKI